MTARLVLGAALALALNAPAFAQHPAGHPDHAPVKPEAGKTVSLQGPQEQAAWANDPYMKKFYEGTKVRLGNGGVNKVDLAAYEADARAIFAEFAKARGVDPAAMQDHLKLIPRQIVQIVKEDPTVLDSYDNFIVAMMGPK